MRPSGFGVLYAEIWDFVTSNSNFFIKKGEGEEGESYLGDKTSLLGTSEGTSEVGAHVL